MTFNTSLIRYAEEGPYGVGAWAFYKGLYTRKRIAVDKRHSRVWATAEWEHMTEDSDYFTIDVYYSDDWGKTWNNQSPPWIIRTIDEANQGTIAVDSLGRPHVFWFDFDDPYPGDEYYGRIWHSMFDGESWSEPDTVVQSPYDTFSAFVWMDSCGDDFGNVHFTAIEVNWGQTRGHFIYCSYNGTVRSPVDVLYETPSDWYSHYYFVPSITVDPRGTVHITYVCENEDGYTEELLYRSKPRQGEWSQEEAIFGPVSDWFQPTIAGIDASPDGVLHVAMFIQTAQQAAGSYQKQTWELRYRNKRTQWSDWEVVASHTYLEATARNTPNGFGISASEEGVLVVLTSNYWESDTSYNNLVYWLREGSRWSSPILVSGRNPSYASAAHGHRAMHWLDSVVSMYAMVEVPVPCGRNFWW